MKEIQNLINKDILKNVEKIIAMDAIENSSKIALAKVDDDFKLFLEIIDIKNDDVKKNIYLDEEFFINNRSLYCSNEFIFENNSSLSTNNLSYVNKFQCLPNHYFYVNISSFLQKKWTNFHLKIDFSGNIIKKFTDDTNDRSDNPLILFDTKEFRYVNLTKFFDDFFEEDSFSYNRAMGDPISTFFSADKKILGISYFFKDEEMPSGRFSFFNVNDFDKPELILSFKIEDYGNDIKFSADNSKISYWRWENNKNNTIIIQYVIRELNEFSFENEERTNIEYSNDFSVGNYYLTDNTIIKEDYNKFQIHNTVTKKNRIISRDNRSPYCINCNMLIYLKNYRLKKLLLS